MVPPASTARIDDAGSAAGKPGVQADHGSGQPALPGEVVEGLLNAPDHWRPILRQAGQARRKIAVSHPTLNQLRTKLARQGSKREGPHRAGQWRPQAQSVNG